MHWLQEALEGRTVRALFRIRVRRLFPESAATPTRPSDKPGGGYDDDTLTEDLAGLMAEIGTDLSASALPTLVIHGDGGSRVYLPPAFRSVSFTGPPGRENRVRGRLTRWSHNELWDRPPL